MEQPKVYQTADGKWTFSFAGQESLFYVNPCDFPAMIQVGNEYVSREQLGLPSRIFPEGSYGIYRCIQRILNGRAREVTWYHRGKVEKVEPEPLPEGAMAAEGVEPAPQFKYQFDGCECDHCYGSRAEANAALGMHAFMNRGAIGRLDDVKSLFDMQHTARTEVVRGQDKAGNVHEFTVDVPARKAVDCCLRGNQIVLTDDTGAEHVCKATVAEVRAPDEAPFRPPMDVTFKQVTEGTPAATVSTSPAAQA